MRTALAASVALEYLNDFIGFALLRFVRSQISSSLANFQDRAVSRPD